MNKVINTRSMDNPWESDGNESELIEELLPEVIQRAENYIDMALGARTFATIKAAISEGDFVSASNIVMALLRLKRIQTDTEKIERRESIEYLLAAISELMSDENTMYLFKWFALQLRRDVMLLTAKERLENIESL